MQCLFFALILQRPLQTEGRSRGFRIWGPSATQIVAPGTVTLLCILRLAYEGWQGWQDILQAAVMLVPVVGAGAIAVSRIQPCFGQTSGPDASSQSLSGVQYRSEAQTRYILSICWYILGSLNLAGYLMASYNNYKASDPYTVSKWAWLASWTHFGKKTEEPPAHVFHSIGSVLRALGDHAWLNAVGWDVIFSAVSLSAWAAVSSADPRGMFKCALWPWLDGTLEAAEQPAEYVVDTTEPLFRVVRDETEKGMEKMMDSGRQAKQYVDQYIEENAHRMGFGPDRRLTKAGRRAASSAAQMVGLQNGDEDDDDAQYPATGSDGDAAEQARARRAHIAKNGKGHDGDDEGWNEVRSRKSSSPTKRRGRPPKERSASQGPGAGGSSSRPASRSRTRTQENGHGHSHGHGHGMRLRNATETVPGKHANRSQSGGWLPDGARRAMQDLPSASEVGGMVTPDVVEGVQAAGLAVALFAMGGLGLASAGVYGADGVKLCP